MRKGWREKTLLPFPVLQRAVYAATSTLLMFLGDFYRKDAHGRDLVSSNIDAFAFQGK